MINRFEMMLVSALLISAIIDLVSSTQFIRSIIFDDHVPIDSPIKSHDVSKANCIQECYFNSECVIFFHNKYSNSCKQYRMRSFNMVDMKFEDGTVSFIRECPSAFTLVKSICFQIIWTYLNRDSAREACRVRNSTLAILDSKDKLSFISDYITEHGAEGSFAIGATDIETEGTWLWENSKPVDLSVFGGKLPDDYDGTPGYQHLSADCGIMFTYYKSVASMNCARAHRSICQVL